MNKSGFFALLSPERSGLFFIIFYCLFSSVSFALNVSDEVLDDLANDRQWKSLLRFDESYGSSTILDGDFFLSENGSTSPRDELRSLVDRFDDPWKGDYSSHPRCMFPARYFWLSQKLNAPSIGEIPGQCTRLLSWPLFRSAKSVSLVFVDGYLGNPASVFGHVFLKINTDSKDSLFDQSVNYGAAIPPNESSFTYIIKGLFGGYLAGFSDRYFYVQDMTYSNTEFRDMWQYHLNLSRKQKRILILHLWEILGKKQKYFFLTRNCAYELGRFLQVALGSEFVDKPNLWYSPIEIVESASDFKNGENHNTDLVKEVGYIPSYERRVLSSYEYLPEALKDKARKGVFPVSISKYHSDIQDVSQEDAIRYLDFLIQIVDFQYMKEYPEVTSETKKIRNELLLERLKMPPGETGYHPEENNIYIPTRQARPSFLGFSVDPLSGEQGLIYSPYSQELLARNNQHGNEVVFFRINLGEDRDSQGLDLVSVDYLNISKRSSAKKFLLQKVDYSWNLKLFSKRKGGGYLHGGDFGLGYSFSDRSRILTPFLFLSVRDRDVFSYPRVDMFWAVNDDLRVLLTTSFGVIPDTASHYDIQLEAGWSSSPSWSVSVLLGYHSEAYASLELKYRW